jgi:dTDP-4-dehydrorhamnose reductase
MKKILITGTTGMLGSNLVDLFNANKKYEVVGLGRSISPLLPKQNQIVVDLSDSSKIEKCDIVPDVIIHSAALTDLSLCEREAQLARKIHVDGSKAVAKLGGDKTKFIYISTDSVFDGVEGNYNENNRPNPLNEYANSKLSGEMAVKEVAKGPVTIIRTNIYGFHVPMKNSLAEWAFREWAVGKTISGFTDTIFNAVFTHQLAVIIEHIISFDTFYPTLNVGSNEAISKFDFLNRFRERLNVNSELLTKALSTDFTSSIQRPRNTSLDVTLLSTFHAVPNFNDGLKDWISRNRSQNNNSL